MSLFYLPTSNYYQKRMFFMVTDVEAIVCKDRKSPPYSI